MKGIILAGGSGTRLYPITKGVSKQLIPLYDKPMIYYPLSTLMLAGINEVLIISTPKDLPRFKELLGDGKEWGINLEYTVQEEPRGLADAFILGADFIGSDKVALVLGDNIFYGSEMGSKLKQYTDIAGGLIFGAEVHDPERYGVVEFDKDMNVVSIVEKPEQPKSKYAIPGLYFFDNKCVEYAKNVKPSPRGEIEITEIQNAYLKSGNLKVALLDRGTAWLDTGTFETLHQAGEFVKVIEHRQGVKVGCPEEIAFRNGWIDRDQLMTIAEPLVKSGYGKYLLSIANS
ncbi:MAG: glucose-1-phosphate thymidylyltransferase RfbA [Candidatus Nomurabacteria bacterium]|nr:MAG: glucose-1-phosphate thymidylyltransferase RfbA [Candidatus Nomurabacteria bacterium]HRV76037.1 glucose-1-phosphate thymidylyltransferase RfbA [Candidatus Saccharimonadales bacterium]